MGHEENGHQNGSAIDELPAEIYRETLKEIIKSHCKSSADECEVTIDSASAKGDNYIGVLYRVTVKNAKSEKLNVIIKLPPQNIARREQFFARPCFLRESEFYDVIYPMYKNFQESKGIVVEKDGFYQIPICYKSLTDEPTEGLFLEDLKVSGFEMFDRFKEVTVEHVNRVMEVLGKYHAISFAIKDQKPELLDDYRGLVDIFFQRDNVSKDQIIVWFDMLKKQAVEALASCNNDEITQRGERVLAADFFELLESCIEGEGAEPYAVLCHGDCWNNNIMYKNDSVRKTFLKLSISKFTFKQSGKPVDVRLLDWQIMRYASPVCDLLYYIFGCTTKSLRDKHYFEFLNVYYSSLSSFLIR
jgi:hypothetical protein